MTPEDSDSDIDPSGSGTTIDEQALAWFVRLRSDSLSQEDRRAFESWRRQSSAHALAFDEVSRLWDDHALKAAAESAAAVGSGFPSTQRWAFPQNRQIWQWAGVAVACTLVIVLAYRLDLVVRLTADHRTATGEQLQVELPDRSTATLNTGSAIAVNFDGLTRKVRLLDGEAFFEVETDRDRPFVVEGRQIFSRAVGTKFVVHRQSRGIRVTVVEGIVELAPSEGGWEPIRLTAGRQAIADSHAVGPVQEVNLATTTAWLRGRLVFENAKLSEVIEELRRYHHGIIWILDPSIREVRVSGSYTLADPDGILTTLAQTLPIRIARLTDRVAVLF